MQVTIAALVGLSLLGLSGCGPSPEDVTRSEAGPGATVLFTPKLSDGSSEVFITNPDGKMRQCAVDQDGHITICTPSA